MDNCHCGASEKAWSAYIYTLYYNKNVDFIWQHLFSSLFPGLNESPPLKSECGINPLFWDEKEVSCLPVWLIVN